MDLEPRLPKHGAASGRTFAGVLAMLLFGCGSGELASEEEASDRTGGSRPPNVVLVLIDTLRPDHLDLYGYGKPTAPFLAELGSRSAVFQEAFSSSSWTAPSTATVFTGLYPPQHGIVEGFRAHRRRSRAEDRRPRSQGESEIEDDGAANEDQAAANEDETTTGDVIETVLHLNRLPEEVATLPELLADQGYRTFGFSTNINIDQLMGFDRGFEKFECQVHFDAAQVFEELQSWKGELASSEPHFLYLHFMDVHVPYHAREPLYRKGRNHLDDVKQRYDSEIHYLDGHLARLYEQLGWDQDTLLLVISDHGEEFRERGAIGHHFSLYREVNRVLWMVHGPGLGVVAGAHGENVSLVDVAPTLLDLLDLEVPEGRSGVSLKPLLVAEPSEQFRDALEQRTLFAHRLERFPVERHLWSAIRGPYRLIEQMPGGARQLFDFRHDVGELNDVAPARAEVVEDLGLALEGLRSTGIRSSGAVDVAMDAELRKSLETLGYLDPAGGGGENDAEDPDR